MKTSRCWCNAVSGVPASVGERPKKLFGGITMDVGDFFALYGGDILGFVFTLISAFFAFLAQKRIKSIKNTLTGTTGTTETEEPAEGQTEIAETAQALTAENKTEVNDMKFQTGYSVSLEVNLNAGQASSQLVVTTSDGKTLAGDEAVKQLQELLAAVKGA